MKIKILTIIVVALTFGVTGNAQRQTVAPKPSASPSPQASPEPVVTSAPLQTLAQADELTDAERADLQGKVKQAELKIALNEIASAIPTGNVTERATRDRETADTMEQLAQLYGKAAKDNTLMQDFIASAFRLSFDKPGQANSRLLMIQAAQNQRLIEQNKKIIQLLEQQIRNRK